MYHAPSPQFTSGYDEKHFLIVFTLCDSTENAHNHFNGIGAFLTLSSSVPPVRLQ